MARGLNQSKMKRFSLLLFTVFVLAFTGCAPDTDSGRNAGEPDKDISGSWSVIKVMRNGQDITSMVNFSQFRVNFLEDGTYNFENYLPFVVREPGTYSLDDRQYAFKINFQTNSQQTQSVDFTFPIIDGNRQIIISGSPGCESNSYTYTLQRVSE